MSVNCLLPLTHTYAVGKTPHLYSHSILGLLERKETRAGSPIAHMSPHRLLARYQPPVAPQAPRSPPFLPSLRIYTCFLLQEEYGLHQDPGHQRVPGLLRG